MKTLVLYATKYGAAGEIARRIAGQLDGVAVHDIKRDNIPSPEGFDCVIVGSSVYAGAIRKEAKEFLSDNEDILLKKKLGIYVSGIGANREAETLSANIPAALLQSAKTAKFLGGVFDPKKAGVFERLIMRIILKSSSYIDKIDDEKIMEFVGEMKA